jgi:hypothetical protein
MYQLKNGDLIRLAQSSFIFTFDHLNDDGTLIDSTNTIKSNAAFVNDDGTLIHSTNTIKSNAALVDSRNDDHEKLIVIDNELEGLLVDLKDETIINENLEIHKENDINEKKFRYVRLSKLILIIVAQNMNLKNHVMILK